MLKHFYNNGVLSSDTSFIIFIQKFKRSPNKMAHIYEKKSLKMTSLHIIFDRAGIYEKEGEYGTSHLMEHLICETFKEYYPTLNKYNIAWNASTGSEFIDVYFTGMDKYFTPELKQNIVKKLLGGLNVTEERFQKEKKVVLQEYMDSFNDPLASLILFNALSCSSLVVNPCL